MLQKGKPIPEELQPPRPEIYREFIQQIFDQEIIQKFRTQSIKAQTDWNYFNAQTKLSLLCSFHEVLFVDFFPMPESKTTYNRVDAAALFYSSLWSMSFTENFLKQHFDLVFKVWLHESFHGFMHFLSLRLNYEAAAEVIQAPEHVLSLARKYPLPMEERIAITLAKRNLIGTLDRANSQGPAAPALGMHASLNSGYMELKSRAGIGWDSYFLNVEIPVENLTEIGFKVLLPNARFQRSYTTADKYIQKRLNGIAPAWAKHHESY